MIVPFKLVEIIEYLSIYSSNTFSSLPMCVLKIFSILKKKKLFKQYIYILNYINLNNLNFLHSIF